MTKTLILKLRLKQMKMLNVLAMSSAIQFFDLAMLSDGHEIVRLDELKSFDFENQLKCFFKIDLLTRDTDGKYYVLENWRKI